MPRSSSLGNTSARQRILPTQHVERLQAADRHGVAPRETFDARVEAIAPAADPIEEAARQWDAHGLPETDAMAAAGNQTNIPENPQGRQ